MEIIKPEMVKAKTTDEGLMAIQREDGKWEEYDPTWDITIHCLSKEDMDNTCNTIKEGMKLLKEYKSGKLGHVASASWIRNGRVSSCKKCSWVVQDESNYCPNCGAHMKRSK